MKTKTVIIIVVVAIVLAAVIWYFTKGKQMLMSTDQKRAVLMGMLTENEIANGDNFDMLNADEVNTAYDYVVNYVKQQKTPPDELAGKVNQLTQKYGIFG